MSGTYIITKFFVFKILSVYIESRGVVKNQESNNQVPHLNRNTIKESDTKTQEKNYTREPGGKPFPSRRPQDCKERMRQHNKNKHEKCFM